MVLFYIFGFIVTFAACFFIDRGRLADDVFYNWAGKIIACFVIAFIWPLFWVWIFVWQLKGRYTNNGFL